MIARWIETFGKLILTTDGEQEKEHTHRLSLAQNDK